MEELCHRDENVARAHEVILGNDRVEVGLVLEFGAGDQIGAPVQRLLPHPRLLLAIGVVVIVMGVLLRILIHITEVNGELLILGFLLLGMRHLYPCGLILGTHRVRWLAEELSMAWSWGRENNAGHEPGRGDLAEEDKKHCSQLPLAPGAGDAANRIHLGLHLAVWLRGFTL